MLRNYTRKNKQGIYEAVTSIAVAFALLCGGIKYADSRIGARVKPNLETRVVNAETNETAFNASSLTFCENKPADSPGGPQDLSYLNVYTPVIKETVSYFNKRHNIDLDSDLIKAVIAVESGGSKEAFEHDPMQIANKGDFALDVLANEEEYTKFIGDFSRLKGKTKTPWDREKKCWNYSNSNMTAEDSIYGGVGWLLNKAAIIIEEGPVTKYTVHKGDSLWKIARDHGSTLETLKKYNSGINYDELKLGQGINFRKARVGFAQKIDWEEAVRRYNGGGDPNYVEKVFSRYKGLKSINP